VRKTRPKLEIPFKVYIYQTLPKSGDWNERDGHVIGEFVCDQIFDIEYEKDEGYSENYTPLGFSDCLDDETFDRYLGGKNGYGWHISELKVYDKPKILREFTPCCKYMLDEKQCDYQKVVCLHQQDSFLEEDGCNCLNFVKQPPQSFCYVEELS
jgi:predicted transcriptional regulator